MPWVWWACSRLANHGLSGSGVCRPACFGACAASARSLARSSNLLLDSCFGLSPDLFSFFVASRYYLVRHHDCCAERRHFHQLCFIPPPGVESKSSISWANWHGDSPVLTWSATILRVQAPHAIANNGFLGTMKAYGSKPDTVNDLKRLIIPDSASRATAWMCPEDERQELGRLWDVQQQVSGLLKEEVMWSRAWWYEDCNAIEVQKANIWLQLTGVTPGDRAIFRP